MRTNIICTVIFISTFLISCTIEDDIENLTYVEDVLIETTIFFKDGTEHYDVTINYYETDGYNNLIEKQRGYSGGLRENKQTFFHTVKEYKKAGLKIIPGENVKEIWINLREVGAGLSIFHQYISTESTGFTFFYNFETDTQEIISE